MSTRDQRALFYDLIGTLLQTKVFGLREKYGCKAELEEKEKNYLWTEQELEYIAKTVRSLKKEKAKNVN